MILNEYGDATGAGEQRLSSNLWLLRVIKPTGRPSHGSLKCPRGKRVSASERAPVPRVTELREIHSPPK